MNDQRPPARSTVSEVRIHRRRLIQLGAVGAAGVILGGARAATAAEARRYAAKGVLEMARAPMATTRLNHTAVAAPALVGGGDVYVAWAAGGGAGGAEPNRQINILRGPDLEHPITLNETSNEAVALTWHADGRALYLGWTGYDGIGRINLLRSEDGTNFVAKQTLDDTCLGGFALASHEGWLVRAWTGGGGLGGGPPDGHINIAWSSSGQDWPDQNRLVLPFTSIAAPALAADPGVGWTGGLRRLYLAWTNPEGHIYYISCGSDAFGELSQAARAQRIEPDGRAEHCFTSPSICFSGNTLYLAWPGTDDAHHINFMKADSSSGAGFYNKVTIPETAAAAIGLEAYAGGWGGRYVYRGTDGVGGLYLTTGFPY